MTEIRFLTFFEVKAIHSNQIELYGGAHGIRDVGLFESAVFAAKVAFGGQFLHRDLFEMAAAYLFHIVQNHPFIDGNKRTGTAAAIVFLELNGFELIAESNELEALVLDVAQGFVGKEAIAAFFRQNIKNSDTQ